MTCSDVDHFLHPYLDGEFESTERLELEQHLAGCEPCARRVRNELRFREAFRQRMREVASEATTTAPPSLRQNVLQGLRRERRRAAAHSWMKASAAVLVVAAASGIYLNLRPNPRQRYLEDAALRHSKGLPFEIVREPNEVEAWFQGKLDHRVSVPRFANARLAGARISNVQERQAAYISYDAVLPTSPTPRRLGLFVFDDPTGELDARPLPQVSVSSSRGYNVAIWRDDGIVYQLVTDLDEADILRLVTMDRSPRRPAPDGRLRLQPASLQQ